jgi:hypothetical protein
MTINQPCWMMTETPGLLQCRLVYISDTHATVLVPDAVKLPKTCSLFFRADGQVGRTCYVIRQTGDKAELSILGKIGSDLKPGREVTTIDS